MYHCILLGCFHGLYLGGAITEKAKRQNHENKNQRIPSQIRLDSD